MADTDTSDTVPTTVNTLTEKADPGAVVPVIVATFGAVTLRNGCGVMNAPTVYLRCKAR